MVAQMVNAGRSTADILAEFDGFERPPDVDEDGVGIHRYEYAGEGEIRKI
jgi:hypothetical protein